jgi:hypothetical protein
VSIKYHAQRKAGRPAFNPFKPNADKKHHKKTLTAAKEELIWLKFVY